VNEGKEGRIEKEIEERIRKRLIWMRTIRKMQSRDVSERLTFLCLRAVVVTAVLDR